jgi:CubicO group peptidase (beta-lactamase class C family)
MSTSADKMDGHIATLMHERNIVGLSLAIIHGGKIIKDRAYGFADKSNKSPVTSATLFKAGSVSKCVATLGAMHLAEQDYLSLYADINTRLHTWNLPENEFTKDNKVTLRHILAHSAGVNVHGFPGYAVDAPCPTQLEVLDGTKPANTPAIRVDAVPGNQPRYAEA